MTKTTNENFKNVIVESTDDVIFMVKIHIDDVRADAEGKGGAVDCRLSSLTAQILRDDDEFSRQVHAALLDFLTKYVAKEKRIQEEQ